MYPTPHQRRTRHLQTVVECLANQIADGSTPIVDDLFTHPDRDAIDLEEMRRLAQLCEDRHLPIEAARIRRWLSEA
jgi:hypothetical protein